MAAELNYRAGKSGSTTNMEDVMENDVDGLVEEEETSSNMLPMDVEQADEDFDDETGFARKRGGGPGGNWMVRGIPFAVIGLVLLILGIETMSGGSSDSSGSAAAADGGGGSTKKVLTEREKAHQEDRKNYHYDDVNDHYTDQAIVEFTLWETESMYGIELDPPSGLTAAQQAQATCTPPEGTPPKCCIGTYTTHLKLVGGQRQSCGNVGQEAYDQLLGDAQQFLGTMGEGDDEKNLCDVCQIADYAGEKDLTISFVGDGMSLQVFMGLECELLRRNYEVDEKSLKTVSCDNNEGGFCELKHKVLEVKTAKGLAVFKFFFQLEATLDDPLRDRWIAADSDIIILNFGLKWEYDDRDQHVQKVVELMHTLTEYQKHPNQLIAFREPSAQHFESKGGDIAFLEEKVDDDGKKMKTICTPLDEEEIEVALWRDQTVKDGAVQAGYNLVEFNPASSSYPPLTVGKNKHVQEMVVLPFFDFTKPYYSMHPTSHATTDCHHFCASPYFYMPIWHSLRLAMDRQNKAGILGG